MSHSSNWRAKQKMFLHESLGEFNNMWLYSWSSSSLFSQKSRQSVDGKATKCETVRRIFYKPMACIVSFLISQSKVTLFLKLRVFLSKHGGFNVPKLKKSFGWDQRQHQVRRSLVTQKLSDWDSNRQWILYPDDVLRARIPELF